VVGAWIKIVIKMEMNVIEAIIGAPGTFTANLDGGRRFHLLFS
jgi:hypothetical protein